MEPEGFGCHFAGYREFDGSDWNRHRVVAEEEEVDGLRYPVPRNVILVIYYLFTKRHLLKVFISVELIATGATLNFVMLATEQEPGQVFLILAFSTDTRVSGVILALLVIGSKRYGTSDIGKILKLMQGKEESEVETS